MERVAFLIEETNERLSCLLNPESLMLRRAAGVRPRRSATGQLTGSGLTDDPLLFTGGGRTQLDLDLLFDVTLAGSTITTEDVRDLTRPLWDLAENADDLSGYGQPPLVRFIWGKTWNIPGVVTAVAEHLEYFTPQGIPRRSWLRLRFLRVPDPSEAAVTPAEAPPPGSLTAEELEFPEESVDVHEVIGGEAAEPVLPEIPELEGDALDGVRTAGDITTSALSSTGAAVTMASDQVRLSSAADTMQEDVASLEVPEEEAPAAEEVNAATETVLSILKSLDTMAGTNIVETITTASAELPGAVEKITLALEEFESEAGREFAEKIGPVLEEVTSAVDNMRTTATVVVAAVKAEAVEVIQVATTRIGVAIDDVSAAVDKIETTASETGARAVEFIQSAVDDVKSVLEQIKTQGQTVTSELVPDAMARISAGVDALWSVGEAAAAREVSVAMESLAHGLMNVRGGAEAITSVDTTNAAEIIRMAVDTIRSTVEGIGEEEEPVAQGIVREALTAIDGAVKSARSIAGETVLGNVPAALDTIEGAIEILDTPEYEEAVQEILEALETVESDVDTMLSQERAVTEEMIKTALEEPEGPGGPGEVQEEAIDRRVGLGERLDVLAYQYYGNPAFWRLLAVFNDIDHPLHVRSGQLLRIPPVPSTRTV